MPEKQRVTLNYKDSPFLEKKIKAIVLGRLIQNTKIKKDPAPPPPRLYCIFDRKPFLLMQPPTRRAVTLTKKDQI